MVSIVPQFGKLLLQLKRIFLNVDLTLAEIDRGYNSYHNLEQTLGEALKSAAPEIFKQED